MKKIIQVFTAASVLLALASVCSATEGILTFSITDAGYVNGTAGWSFQALQNISVTSLGGLDSLVTNMDQSPVSIGLWNQSGSLLASTAITATPGFFNPQYDYQSITPVTLTAGQTYYLGAYSASGTTLVFAETPSSGGFATTSPQIQLGTAVSSAGGFAFPNLSQGGPGAAFLVPNFEFTVVPEPSVFALVGLGVAGVAYRFRPSRR